MHLSTRPATAGCTGSARNSASQIGEVVEAARAVADTLRVNVHAIEQREPQIRRGCALGILQEATRLDRTISPPRNQDRQVDMRVLAAVGDAAAINDHRMIEQIS